MKTFIPKAPTKKWYLIDAQDQVVGRMAVKIANVLRGKEKAIYTPHLDTGDCVVVINADKLKLTGGKWIKKEYFHYSGYPGGMRVTAAKHMKPENIIYEAVRGMLPKNKLQKVFLGKLKIYKGPEHQQTAQKPEVIQL